MVYKYIYTYISIYIYNSVYIQIGENILDKRGIFPTITRGRKSSMSRGKINEYAEFMGNGKLSFFPLEMRIRV